MSDIVANEYTGDRNVDELLDSSTEWCYLRDDGDSLHLDAKFVVIRGGVIVASQHLVYDADRAHPEDLQMVLQEMGVQASSDTGHAFSWYHAAVLSKWFRREFYR